MAALPFHRGSVDSLDEERMREIYAFTARTLDTPRPGPLRRAHREDAHRRAPHARDQRRAPRERSQLPRRNAHRPPRLQKAQRPNLEGYTMYSTCEPCPMCMANALWARLDRVVYGATIADANRHCLQIHIDAKEVVRRSDMHCIVDGPFCATSATASSPIPTCSGLFARGARPEEQPRHAKSKRNLAARRSNGAHEWTGVTHHIAAFVHHRR